MIWRTDFQVIFPQLSSKSNMFFYIQDIANDAPLSYKNFEWFWWNISTDWIWWTLHPSVRMSLLLQGLPEGQYSCSHWGLSPLSTYVPTGLLFPIQADINYVWNYHLVCSLHSYYICFLVEHLLTLLLRKNACKKVNKQKRKTYNLQVIYSLICKI